jgi:DNA-directed RNA polymerase subunit RPC12/RpoP
LKNEKTHEYSCDHCGATFAFVETTRKEVIHDTRSHTCPICGRPVKVGEGYSCKYCGNEYLCNKCVELDHKDKVICKVCIEKRGWNCDDCSSQHTTRCVVCGSKRCEKHASIFDAKVQKYFKKRKQKVTLYNSTYCAKCSGYVCEKCREKKRSLLGGKIYVCKKCGSELKFSSPQSKLGQDIEKIEYGRT